MYNNRAVSLFENHVKVRIGIVANNHDDCELCDSCMGFGISVRSCQRSDATNKPCGPSRAGCGGNSDIKWLHSGAYLFSKNQLEPHLTIYLHVTTWLYDITNCCTFLNISQHDHEHRCAFVYFFTKLTVFKVIYLHSVVFSNIQSAFQGRIQRRLE